jgi:hypothetical protein
LSKIKSTPAKVDSEFDMLAQSRSETKKEMDVDLLQGQPKEFDEIEEWLKAEKAAANDGGEESLTSKEFDKFLAERAAVAETLPNVKNEGGSQPK